MKKTVRDIEKLSDKSVKYIKMGLYYLAIPAVLALGAKTVDLLRFGQPQI
jgi:hypothetical protein